MNQSHARNGRIWTGIILGLWGLICALAVFPEALGRAEGRAVPVISDFKITSAESTPDGATVIRAEGIKSRLCALRDVDWTLNDGVLEAAVGFDNREIQRVNRTGPVNFGPWVLYASREELLETGRAFIVHRCHPMFLTRTPIFDARDAE